MGERIYLFFDYAAAGQTELANRELYKAWYNGELSKAEANWWTLPLGAIGSDL